MQKKHSKKAFSLIELSIVILIVSILVAGSLGVSKTSVSNSKAKITKDRMDTIYKAIGNFVATNRRIPCPADLRIAKGSSGYGTEGTTPGTCNGTFKTSNAAGVNMAYGMVPIVALGLDIDMAEDGFGTKFSYVVDKRFTLVSSGIAATDGFEITKSTISEADATNLDLSGLNIYGAGISTMLPNQNGVLALISHGANKFGGFNASGTSQNPFATVAEEQDNSCSGANNVACTTDASTAAYHDSFAVSANNQNFDDIVMFKTKSQLVRDAGLEFIMCNKDEAATLASNVACGSVARTWANNGNYGDNVPYTASGAVCYKTCGKYGIWSSAKAGINVSTVTKLIDYVVPSAANSSITSSSFTYRGGTLIFICSGSEYIYGVNVTPVTAKIINSADSSVALTLGTLQITNNTPGNYHQALVTRTFVVTSGLTVGASYKFKFEWSYVDGNDVLDAVMINLP